VPVIVNGQVEACITLVFFATAMSMAEAVRRYAEDLKQTAEELSVKLAGAMAPMVSLTEH
jgi:DNA-binding IclR family transcriptional regulator